MPRRRRSLWRFGRWRSLPGNRTCRELSLRVTALLLVDWLRCRSSRIRSRRLIRRVGRARACRALQCILFVCQSAQYQKCLDWNVRIRKTITRLRFMPAFRLREYDVLISRYSQSSSVEFKAVHPRAFRRKLIQLGHATLLGLIFGERGPLCGMVWRRRSELAFSRPFLALIGGRLRWYRRWSGPFARCFSETR